MSWEMEGDLESLLREAGRGLMRAAGSGRLAHYLVMGSLGRGVGGEATSPQTAGCLPLWDPV